MNTLRSTPYLLCPNCKGRVRADATAQNGVAKCPVCKDAGLLAMHHSSMGGRWGKGVVLLAAFTATSWLVFPGIGRFTARNNQSPVQQLQVPAAAANIEESPAQPDLAADLTSAGEKLSSSIVPGNTDTVADYHEVARLHRMVAVSAARMEDLRKSFADAIGKSKLDGMFDPAVARKSPETNIRAIEAASALAADYQAECEQVARDLRVAISEAAVSEAARERGLEFFRAVCSREQSMWQEVTGTFRDGMHAVSKAGVANTGKTERAAVGKSGTLATLDKRWSDVREDLVRPAAMPPLPGPTGIATQGPVRLRGSK